MTTLARSNAPVGPPIWTRDPLNAAMMPPPIRRGNRHHHCIQSGVSNNFGRNGIAMFISQKSFGSSDGLRPDYAMAFFAGLAAKLVRNSTWRSTSRIWKA